RVRAPAAVLVADAEHAEAPLLQQAFRLRPRQLLVRLRIPALAEVPESLSVAPADDRDFAAAAQQLEHEAHLGSPPPDVMLFAHARVVLDLAREERTAPLELAQHVAAEGSVRLEEFRAAELPRVRAAPPSHPRPDQREVLDRPDERAPLEELPLLPQQTVELCPLEGS